MGARLDGPTSHIKISVKEDLLGIGASRKDAESGWLTNSKSYQEVLDRLAKSVDNDTKKRKDKKSKSEKKVKKEQKASKTHKSRKEKEEKASKKHKDRKEKEEKKVKKVEKAHKDKKEEREDLHKEEKKEKQKLVETESKPSSVTANVRAHRAKFIRNKSVASYSSVHLKEILGGINL